MRNHPVTLCRRLDEAAPGWSAWEIEAVWDALQDLPEGAVDLEDPALPDLLGALQVMRERPELFWGEWEVFENCAHALNGNTCDFVILQPVSPAEAALAVALARRNCPRDGEDEGGKDGEDSRKGEMTYEVSAYIEAVLHANGMSAGVGPLEGIVDRSAHPGRRERALARYRELLEQGTEATIEEVEPDVEATRMLAVTLYVNEHLPEADPPKAPAAPPAQATAEATAA